VPLGDSGTSSGSASSDPARELTNAVQRGESFSGNERHVVYQNIAGKFRDVSGITGLDLPDDGRAAAFTDWDGDGDLDLWVSNRGAPAVRFFQNDNPSGRRSLTIKLVGATCNRDAVGARAVLHFEKEPSQTRSVTAGSGFLAQSSKTLHFGLSNGSTIKNLVIHWPGGKAQTITGLAPGKYRIGQGAPPQENRPQTPAILPPPSPTAITPKRTFFAARPPIATLFSRPTETTRRPLLLTLTSDTCADCTAQLTAWRTNPPAGVALKTLSIETLKRDDPERLRLLQIAADHPFDIKGRPMQTPLSFLIDANDLLCALYRGPIDPATLTRDIANLSLDADRRRATSLPFPGHWTGGSPPIARPLSLAEDLLDAGLLNAAERYIEHYREELEHDEIFPALLGRLRELKAKIDP